MATTHSTPSKAQRKLMTRITRSGRGFIAISIRDNDTPARTLEACKRRGWVLTHPCTHPAQQHGTITITAAGLAALAR